MCVPFGQEEAQQQQQKSRKADRFSKPFPYTQSWDSIIRRKDWIVGCELLCRLLENNNNNRYSNKCETYTWVECGKLSLLNFIPRIISFPFSQEYTTMTFIAPPNTLMLLIPKTFLSGFLYGSTGNSITESKLII